MIYKDENKNGISRELEDIILDINFGVVEKEKEKGKKIKLKSGDRKSRVLAIQIMDNGEPFDLTGMNATMYVLKPDKTKVFLSAEITNPEFGNVMILLTEQVLIAPGIAKCEIVLTANDDSLLSTAIFNILIEESINDKNTLESSDEFSALVDALDSVHNLDDQIERLDTGLRDAIEHLTEIEDDVAIIDETLALAKDFTGANEHRLVQDKDKMDYLGNVHDTIRDARNATVNWMLGEINTLDYEGQHITVNNSIEGHVKSAILKGQTLVNIQSPARYHLSTSCPDGTFTDRVESEREISYTVSLSTSGHWYYISAGSLNLSLIKPSTKYIVLFEKCEGIETVSFMNANATNVIANNSRIITNVQGIPYAIVTTLDEYIDSTQVLYMAPKVDIGTKVHVKNVMVIEYQEGMENWDIPYFTGMSSVKMPVLTTTGNNLFDDKISFINVSNLVHSENSYSWTVTDWNQGGYIDIKIFNNSSLHWRMEKTEGATYPCFYESLALDSNKTKISPIKMETYNDNYLYLHSIPTNAKYIRVQFKSNTTSGREGFKNLSVSTDSTALYEPYKPKTLTVNEEVELRGIGDVQDELDLLTGKLTQRVNEIVLDGSNGQFIEALKETKGDYLKFGLQLELVAPFIHNVPSLSDNMNTETRATSKEGQQEQIYIHSHTATNTELRVCILPSKLQTPDANGFNLYLSENPITVQYPLASESVKTVDLSDNVVYSYDKVTHYDCSSESGSLVPTLAVKVPTNVNAVISNQRTTIQEQTEQINTLEEEKALLIEQNEMQDVEIALNQEAINFMLFEAMGMSTLNENGGNPMAAYFANQIIKRKLNYTQVVNKYPQFKEDIDLILIAEGYGDLIVE